MTINELATSLRGIERQLLFLKETPSLNELEPCIYCSHRLVYQIDDRIYRIASPMEIRERILVQRYFKSKGIELFEEDKWEDKIATEHFGVSSQAVMDEVNPKGQKELFGELPKEFSDLGVIWFQGKNCGIKDNKIKILDWASNTTITQKGQEWQLLNGNQEVIFSAVDKDFI